MERIIATFWFTEKYRRVRDIHDQDATVVLTVNYRQKTFSVVPSNSSDDKFAFIHNSNDYQKWYAVIEAIKKAIAFGNEEIGVTRRDRPAE